MKRFKCGLYGESVTVEQHPEGEWVRYEDARDYVTAADVEAREADRLREQISKMSMEHLAVESHWVETQARLEKKLEVLSASFEGMNLNCAEAWKQRDAARAEVERLKKELRVWSDNENAWNDAGQKQKIHDLNAEVEDLRDLTRMLEGDRSDCRMKIERLGAQVDGYQAEVLRLGEKVCGLAAALREIEPFLPRLDEGPVRFSAHAQAAGKAREALEKFGGEQ